MQKHDMLEMIQNLAINNITIDSREARLSSAFFVMNNTALSHINQAIENGAMLIVTDNPDVVAKVPVCFVDDVRLALAEVVKFFYPKVPAHKVAVTGTNGKTSVVHYFTQACELLGLRAASVGTMGLQLTDQKLKSALHNIVPELTTPDVVSMYKIMSELAQSGIEHFAFEASSHGLDQKRIYGIDVDVAGFTSLSHDHLDYHKTFEDYKLAKLKLFSENLTPGGLAVLNADVQDYESIRDYITANGRRVISVGSDGDVKINSISQNIYGQEIDFVHAGKSYHFKTSILGSFQATNLLITAVMIEFVSKMDFNLILSVLEKLQAAKGRLERALGSDYHVFIDYAHTPDALEKSITELAALAEGRLFTLFGCGGDRDKTKRPIMGAIASRLSDVVVITDDNPRTEDAADIRRDVSSNAINEVQIAGREEAIKYAIEAMQKGDILLIAGKGHEDYQIIGKTKYPFDDVLMARKYLAGKK